MFIAPSGVRRDDVTEWVYVHIGVGFCVARSTKPGNAKASMRGTSSGTDSHAFLSLTIDTEEDPVSNTAQ